MNNTHFDNIIFSIASLAPLWAILRTILWLIVDISFALAVLADARALRNHLNRRPFFVSGWIWAVATLFGGVFVAAIYWAIHHSTLRPQPFSNDSADRPSAGTAGPAKAGL